MGLPFEIGEYIGHGVFGVVFKAEYMGEHVAAKFQQSSLPYDSDCEYKNLKALKGIAGIPEPKGYFRNLKVSITEKKVPSELLENCFLSHPILMEYVPGKALFKLGYYKFVNASLSLEFICELEKLFNEIHSRRFLVPGDVTLIDNSGRPYLVDWGLKSWKGNSRTLEKNSKRLTQVISNLKEFSLKREN